MYSIADLHRSKNTPPLPSPHLPIFDYWLLIKIGLNFIISVEQENISNKNQKYLQKNLPLWFKKMFEMWLLYEMWLAYFLFFEKNRIFQS